MQPNHNVPVVCLHYLDRASYCPPWHSCTLGSSCCLGGLYNCIASKLKKFLHTCTYSTLQYVLHSIYQLLCVGIHCIKNPIKLAVFKEVKFFELQKVPSRDWKIYCCSDGEGCSRRGKDTRSELKGKQLRTGEL